MVKVVCRKCMAVYESEDHDFCPNCRDDGVYNFRNSEKYLRKKIQKVLAQREKHGLAGLVGGLEAVIINTELDRQEAVVDEFLRHTGFTFLTGREDAETTRFILQAPNSADLWIQTRKTARNPFIDFNIHPKSQHLPNTRLETFVFETPDIERYYATQKERGVQFLTEKIQEGEDYSFIQTIPSAYTGNSLGFIQWHGEPHQYTSNLCKTLKPRREKQSSSWLQNITYLDHTATRVRAQDRDAAIIEYMDLTNYDFDFAVYVKVFNSITNVARLSGENFAMVFTSGISPFTGIDQSGPTEKFIHNYGTRVHHMAFQTENIDQTYEALKKEGLEYLIELVGSPEEGLKQTFTVPSKHTLLVNEYIHRYGDFDGFFTRSNVTLLTGATDKQ